MGNQVQKCFYSAKSAYYLVKTRIACPPDKDEECVFVYTWFSTNLVSPSRQQPVEHQVSGRIPPAVSPDLLGTNHTTREEGLLCTLYAVTQIEVCMNSLFKNDGHV